VKLKFGITGGTGSLGRNLIKNYKNIKFVKYRNDIRNKKKVFEWVIKNKFVAIIHLAAIVPIKIVNKNKKKAYQVNYEGTKNIVDATLKSETEWFFFSSTSHVYRSSKKKISENSIKKPISFYGQTKYLSEKYIIKSYSNSKKKYCIGRIFSTSNKNQKNNYLVPDLIKKISNAKNTINLYNLNHYRDFISMNEISKIIIRLYRVKFKGIINIGRGKKVYLKDIAKLVCKKYKKKYNFIDKKEPTYLIANNKKLKKIINLKNEINLRQTIF